MTRKNAERANRPASARTKRSRSRSKAKAKKSQAGSRSGRSQKPRGSEPSRRPDVFVSYSHRDRFWKDWLLADRVLSTTLGTVEVWSDDEIQPSDNWGDEIKQALERARVAVLLVSKSFLNSRFVREHELPAILRRRRAQDSLVLWVPIDDSRKELEGSELGEIQAAWPLEDPLERIFKEQSNEMLAAAREHICQRILYALDPVGAKVRSTLPLKYEVTRQIGVGRSKSVYLALDRVMQRWVTVSALNEGEDLEEFRQSLLHASRVDDIPGFMTVYDAWLDRSPPYCVRQFVDGASVWDRLQHHAMSFDYARDILLSVGRALDAAHARGFYHLNIKPSNVWIDPDDRALLSPLSRHADYVAVITEKWEDGRLSREDLAYAVPELFGRHVPHRSYPACDQYMLGQLGYHMISGKLPLRLGVARPPRSISDFKALRPLAESCPACPKALAAAIHRMCQRSPDDRFPTLGEALDEIKGSS